ncbi:response regulator [Planctomycetales bacterium ZRK34]|nr:response regulator [Planctomycetales bacterium ZRK34]
MLSTRSIQILLVEDDPVHARLIRRALGEQIDGSVVCIEHVADGEAALEHMLGAGHSDDGGEQAGDSPDLVLLDLRLPSIDGFDVLSALRASDTTRRLPVVIVSTSDHETDINRCYGLGANAFVTKSSDFDELTDKMTQLSQFWLHAAELPRN